MRLLAPGELDPYIVADSLTRPPAPARSAATEAACWRLFHRYVEPGAAERIPDAAFCELARADFLAFLVEECGIVLTGANEPDRDTLEPMVLARNVAGWERPRLFAFAEPVSPIFHAVADKARVRATTIVFRPGGYYFGLDYRALPDGPWRRGTVYCYARADLPADFESVPQTGAAPIRARAKLWIDPWDWPLLDRVHGTDFAAQARRERDGYDGYPWTSDETIHPHRGERAALEPLRTLLETDDGWRLDLEALGRRAGMSPSTLLRRFRAAFGISPREGQLLARVGRAKALLRAGAAPAQAAIETGFCDQSHLTAHFQRLVGVTPGKYVRLQESPIRAG